ncbi:MAG: MBOAT family O-acyltransferase, partial [Bacteroidia bacterium]|nr:MBOAT family O-acyltransferase [Bacteroidia bacterium]
MLFNSLEFIVFFPIVCIAYWTMRAMLPESVSLKARNIMLLLASYYFYMCWKPIYVLLLLGSTIITYTAAIFIDKYNENTKKKKSFLTLAIVLNLAILFFYKYFNFAAASISTFMRSSGIGIEIPGLDILLPVGISFYIFQALGYSIDVYRGEIKAERNFFTYALFVSFFPQLVAGPIERSTNLLRQFKEDHKFDYNFAMSGFRLMLWGYFLKLCLADRAAGYVDAVFNNLASHEGYSTLIASVFFSLQIYGDFAGYTFIAIGCARILGFSLRDNFCRPYFSASVTEFWRRWHISLSTWLRDYIYFPLGGSKTTKVKTLRNLLITFGISGIWHGANWTFVLWGLIHGLVMCLERILGINKKQWSFIPRTIHIIFTLIIINFAWMLFRANNISDFFTALRLFFTPSDFTYACGDIIFMVLLPTIILLAKEIYEEY